jgi:3-methyladenine DNA glycosylase AlkD
LAGKRRRIERSRKNEVKNAVGWVLKEIGKERKEGFSFGLQDIQEKGIILRLRK